MNAKPRQGVTVNDVAIAGVGSVAALLAGVWLGTAYFDYWAPWNLEVYRLEQVAKQTGRKWLNAGAGLRCVHSPNCENIDLVPCCSCTKKIDLMQRTPYRDKEFCGAMSCHVFEHLPDPEKVWDELARICDDQVHIVPGVANPLGWTWFEHYWVFPKSHLTSRQDVMARAKLPWRATVP